MCLARHQVGHARITIATLWCNPEVKTWRFLPPSSITMVSLEADDVNSPAYRHGTVDLFVAGIWAGEAGKAMEFVLRPGDMLFVPRGWVHAVQSREGFSASVNWFYNCSADE